MQPTRLVSNLVLVWICKSRCQTLPPMHERSQVDWSVVSATDRPMVITSMRLLVNPVKHFSDGMLWNLKYVSITRGRTREKDSLGLFRRNSSVEPITVNASSISPRVNDARRADWRNVSRLVSLSSEWSLFDGEVFFSHRNASGLDSDGRRTSKQTTENRREPTSSPVTLSRFLGHGWRTSLVDLSIDYSLSFRRSLVFGNRVGHRAQLTFITGRSPENRTRPTSLPRFRSLDIVALADALVSSHCPTHRFLGDGQRADEHSSDACHHLL